MKTTFYGIKDVWYTRHPATTESLKGKWVVCVRVDGEGNTVYESYPVQDLCGNVFMTPDKDHALEVLADVSNNGKYDWLEIFEVEVEL